MFGFWWLAVLQWWLGGARDEKTPCNYYSDALPLTKCWHNACTCRFRTIHQGVVCPTRLTSIQFQLEPGGCVRGISAQPLLQNSEQPHVMVKQQPTRPQKPQTHHITTHGCSRYQHRYYYYYYLYFPSWVFTSIMLCSPCLSPAPWCSPGCCRAAPFPVKEISGAFLVELALTL